MQLSQVLFSSISSNRTMSSSARYSLKLYLNGLEGRLTLIIKAKLCVKSMKKKDRPLNRCPCQEKIEPSPFLFSCNIIPRAFIVFPVLLTAKNLPYFHFAQKMPRPAVERFSLESDGYLFFVVQSKPMAGSFQGMRFSSGLERLYELVVK